MKKQKTEQIERGENWIVEFWRVRGFEIVKTALGISFSLHRKPEFECRGLGLDLTYLEQFAEEAVKRSSEFISRECNMIQTRTFHRPDEASDFINENAANIKEVSIEYEDETPEQENATRCD